jgi:hypothetical protein
MSQITQKYERERNLEKRVGYWCTDADIAKNRAAERVTLRGKVAFKKGGILADVRCSTSQVEAR